MPEPMKNTIPLLLSLLMLLSFASSCTNRNPDTAESFIYDHVAGDRPTGKAFATRSPVLGPNGMAASVHPLATQIALDVMKTGGNAVDAAIAANAALTLMNPIMCGLGGDLFAIVWDPQTEQLYGLNASGRSPQGLSFEQLREELDGRTRIPMYGPLSVSVPGAVDGWFEMHDRFGTVPMRTLLEPTILYARNGFPITPVTAHYWDVDGIRLLQENSDDITEMENLMETFTIDGRAPQAGELFTNPDFA
ncbi:MAG: gamma-glutamyltransferase, partial [Balneolaceae bacterium]|nr:gamma-glutamyltransferase [Balneolaceae bacterium]